MTLGERLGVPLAAVYERMTVKGRYSPHAESAGQTAMPQCRARPSGGERHKQYEKLNQYINKKMDEDGSDPNIAELLHLSFRVRCHEPDIFMWDSICDASPWAL